MVVHACFSPPKPALHTSYIDCTVSCLTVEFYSIVSRHKRDGKQDYFIICKKYCSCYLPPLCMYSFTYLLTSTGSIVFKPSGKRITFSSSLFVCCSQRYALMAEALIYLWLFPSFLLKKHPREDKRCELKTIA